MVLTLFSPSCLETLRPLELEKYEKKMDSATLELPEWLTQAPSPSQLALTFLTIYVGHSFYSWYRLSHVPGPFWAAFSKFWLVRESLKGHQPNALKEAIDKYGMAAIFPVQTRYEWAPRLDTDQPRRKQALSSVLAPTSSSLVTPSSCER